MRGLRSEPKLHDCAYGTFPKTGVLSAFIRVHLRPSGFSGMSERPVVHATGCNVMQRDAACSEFSGARHKNAARCNAIQHQSEGTPPLARAPAPKPVSPNTHPAPNPLARRPAPARIWLKTYATTRAGNRAGRWKGYQAVPADQGTRQTRRPLRREVSHHRLRPEQFHQLGHLFRLRADAVQEPVAAAAPQRRMAVRRPAEDPVHHPGAGPDALRGRNLVPGHGRRHLPEHQPGGAGRSARGGHLRRRPHLPHEHQQHDRVPRAEERHA